MKNIDPRHYDIIVSPVVTEKAKKGGAFRPDPERAAKGRDILIPQCHGHRFHRVAGRAQIQLGLSLQFLIENLLVAGAFGFQTADQRARGQMEMAGYIVQRPAFARLLLQ